MRDWVSGKINLETLLAFAFGVICVLLLLVLQPKEGQETTFRIVMALAAAGIAAVIPGMLNITAKSGTRFTIRAAGAMAVFVIVYLINPGQW
jgi:hypothetical protein